MNTILLDVTEVILYGWHDHALHSVSTVDDVKVGTCVHLISFQSSSKYQQEMGGNDYNIFVV